MCTGRQDLGYTKLKRDAVVNDRLSFTGQGPFDLAKSLLVVLSLMLV